MKTFLLIIAMIAFPITIPFILFFCLPGWISPGRAENIKHPVKSFVLKLIFCLIYAFFGWIAVSAIAAAFTFTPYLISFGVLFIINFIRWKGERKEAKNI